MNRPHYEQQHDLDVELDIATAWGKVRNMRPVKLPCGARYSIDFGMFRDNILQAVIEVKDRPTWRQQYKTVILGLSKVRELHSYFQMGVPAYFVARLSGEICSVKVDDRIKDWNIRWMGRNDRGDSADMEPCVDIPYHYFDPLTNRTRFNSSEVSEGQIKDWLRDFDGGKW